MSANAGPTHRDMVKSFLLARGEAEVAATTDQIAGGTGLKTSQVHGALYQMEKSGEVTIIKHQQPSGYNKVIDVKLNKMEQKETIDERIKEAADKKVAQVEMRKISSSKLPATLAYADQKLAIEEAKAVLLKHGMSTSLISFEQTPLGEESIWLLSQLEDMIEKNNRMKIELRGAENLISNLRGTSKETDAKELQPVPVSASSH